jgi:hypothetical protein
MLEVQKAQSPSNTTSAAPSDARVTSTPWIPHQPMPVFAHNLRMVAMPVNSVAPPRA